MSLQIAEPLRDETNLALLRLLREGVYQYDPSNYHGPLLYVLSVVPLFLCGTTVMLAWLDMRLFLCRIFPTLKSVRP